MKRSVYIAQILDKKKKSFVVLYNIYIGRGTILSIIKQFRRGFVLNKQQMLCVHKFLKTTKQVN